MEPDKKSNGTIVGIIVIIAILIIGGVYTWQSKVKSALKEKEIQENTIQNDASVLDSLEQDLQNTDTNLNVDVNTIQ
ncbi:MAG: hypothetical protein WC783_04095 [Candidatus Paceibacterota bacterium]|jgi:hypothetical protein